MSGPAAYHFYSKIVMALHFQGQFEGTQSLLLGLGLQAYELLVSILVLINWLSVFVYVVYEGSNFNSFLKIFW